MEELFANVPQRTRNHIKFWLEMAFMCKNPEEGAKMLMDYRNSLVTEEERDFMDFCFNARMEELKK